MKKLAALALALLLVLGSVPALAESAPAGKTLTLMLYIAGNNLETNSGWASSDLAEIFSSDYDSDRIHVCLALGGALQWQIEGVGEAGKVTEVYVDMNGDQLVTFGEMPSASMGDPETLSRFINDCVGQYPADSYALVMWDHGGGPITELCMDETQNDDGLLMTELRDALAATPFGGENKLEWIAMDACLMGSAEVAGICAPYARYMVASEEIMIAPSFDYKVLMDGLAGDADTAATCRRMADCYIDGYVEFWKDRDPAMLKNRLTISVIDLSRIGDVEAALDALFSSVDAPVDVDSYVRMARGRVGAEEFGLASGMHYDLVDIVSMAGYYTDAAPGEAADLIAAVNGAVVYNRAMNVENANGLTLYYPHYTPLFYIYPLTDPQNGMILPVQDLAFAKGYTAFLEAYVKTLTGEPLGDWNAVDGSVVAEAADDGVRVRLNVPAEQASMVDSVRLVSMAAFDDSGIGGYFVTDTVGDVHVADGDAALLYHPRSLAVIDEDGSVVRPNVTYTTVEDFYFIAAVLEDLDYEDARQYREAGKMEHVWLVGTLNGENGLDIIAAVRRNPTDNHPGEDWKQQAYSGLFLNGSLWPTVTLVSRTRMPATDDDGRLLAADFWPMNYTDGETGEEHVYAWETAMLDNTREWKLVFRDYPGSIYGDFAQMIVRDLQGREHATGLVELPGLAVRDRCELGQTLFSGDEGSVVLERVDAVNNGVDSGLLLRFRIEGSTDALTVKGVNITLDGTPLKEIARDPYEVFGNMYPGMTEEEIESWKDTLEVLYPEGEYMDRCELRAFHDPEYGDACAYALIDAEYLPEADRAGVLGLDLQIYTNEGNAADWTYLVGSAGDGRDSFVHLDLPLDLDLTGLR